MSARRQLTHRKTPPCGVVGYGHRKGLWRFSKGAFKALEEETPRETIARLTETEDNLSWLSKVALDHLMSIKANVNLLKHMVFQYKLLFSRQ